MYRTTLSVAALGVGILLLAGLVGSGDGGSSLVNIDLGVLQSILDAIMNFFDGLSGSGSA